VIVRVHSLGSLWQTKELPNGGTRVWNTTGIRDGIKVRSYATLFGQLVFGARSKPFLQQPSQVQGRNWIAGDINESSDRRSMRLVFPAAPDSTADWYLTTVNEQLVGLIGPEGFDPERSVVLSASQRKDKQELLLLVKPLAWLSGASGSAVFEIAERGPARWKTRGW